MCRSDRRLPTLVDALEPVDPTGQAELVDAAVMFVVVAVLTLLTVLAVWSLQRGAGRDGARRGGSIGDAMGNFIDVFDPAQSRAARDLQEQRHTGPVTPVPDPDPDDPVRLVLGPDGEPRSVTIRRREQ